MREDILNGLNEVQKQVVLYDSGPSLVVAGAGSGKTRVLTYKIAHLIERGIPASKIIALTFTNKAAKEMKKRIDELLGYKVSNNLWMGTFHSIFGRIIRIEAENLGFTSNFTIYDTADSLSLIKSIIKEKNLNDEYYKPRIVFNRISACKNNLLTHVAYKQKETLLIEDEKANRKYFIDIYTEYANRCRRSNVMDFDDLLLFTNILFKQHPEILEKYRNKFSHVLVDEYQDTNFAQYLIIKKLSEMHRKVFVVGDDAQSIYSFRGAKIENILNFKNDYPDYKLFKLEQNYRSTKNIVKAANSLIKNNKAQIPKTIFSDNESGKKIRVEKSMTDTLEGMMVARKIVDMCESDNFRHSDFAILYRTNAQSRIIEEAMRKYNIPYKVYGGLSFYQRKEIKDVLAYIRFIANHNDIESFRRIVNYPMRKIGNTTIMRLLEFSSNSNTPIWELINKPFDYNIKINNPTKERLVNFANLISYFSNKIEDTNAYELISELVTKSGLNNTLFTDKTPEGISRYENVQELLNGVKEFCSSRDNSGVFTGISIYDYLENVSILTGNTDEEEDVENVALMTIHSAKGLEFTNVFIVGVEENVLPNIMSMNSQAELEEERRLFYVAITRAMKNLMITYSASRYKFGSITNSDCSRFLKEIDSTLLDWPEKQRENDFSFDDEFTKYNSHSSSNNFNKYNKVKKPPQSRKLISLEKSQTKVITNQKYNDYRVGQKVKHNIFGIGLIKEISEQNGNMRAIIKFENDETKTILLKFAKLQILE